MSMRFVTLESRKMIKSGRGIANSANASEKLCAVKVLASEIRRIETLNDTWVAADVDAAAANSN